MKLSNGQLILILCMQDVDLNSQVHVHVYSVATDELYKSFKSAPIQMGYRSSVSQQCWCLSVYIYMFVFLAAKPQYTSCQVSQTVNRYPVTCFVYSWVERGLVQAENTITPTRLQPKCSMLIPLGHQASQSMQCSWQNSDWKSTLLVNVSLTNFHYWFDHQILGCLWWLVLTLHLFPQ